MPTFGFLSFFFFLSAVSAFTFDRADGVFVAMLLSILMALLQAFESPPPKPKIRYRDGYVYVIQSLTNETYYKIGRTRDLHRRAKTFGVLLPFDVQTVCTIKTDDMYKLEGELHGRYMSKRVKQTEWFILSDDDLKWLKNYSGSVR